MEEPRMSNVKCVYEGKSYDPGAVVTQSGIKMRAGDDGRWHAGDEKVSDKEVSAAAVGMCEYAGQPYSEGSLICQAGSQMRCTNNSNWSPTGAGC
jgi:hypothetical protein